MRGKLFKALAASLVLILLVSLIPMALAAREKPYTYTVRIYAGARGSIGGQDVITYSGLQYGERINLQNDFRRVEVSDEKYYAKGLRESGRDNNSAVAALSFAVTRDIDFVVAYGVRGNDVAYTINYLDSEGNTLLPSETYYGNVGDKPVVAYQFIEDYTPNYYNITGTLQEDASKNVFNFTYTRMVEPTTPTTPTQPTQPTQPENPEQPTQPTDTSENPGPTDSSENNPTEPSNPTDSSGPTEPSDIIDIDTTEGPAGPTPGGDKESKASDGLSTGAIVGITGGGLGSIGLLALLIALMRKRKKETAQKNAQGAQRSNQKNQQNNKTKGKNKK